MNVSAPVDATVARLSLRSLLGTRRGTLLFILPLILLAVAGLVRALAGTDLSVTAELQSALGFGTVVPLVALIAGTGILAPEMDDGSIVYLLAKPLSRHRIVISKVVVAVSVTLALTAVPMAVSSLLLAGPDGRLAAAYVLGCVVGAAGYCCIFVMPSVLTKHSVVWGLVYWLIWEGLLGSVLSGVRWLSIGHWCDSIASWASDGDALSGDVGVAYVVVATVLVLCLAVVIAGERLRGFNLTGDD